MCRSAICCWRWPRQRPCSRRRAERGNAAADLVNVLSGLPVHARFCAAVTERTLALKARFDSTASTCRGGAYNTAEVDEPLVSALYVTRMRLMSWLLHRRSAIAGVGAWELPLPLCPALAVKPTNAACDKHSQLARDLATDSLQDPDVELARLRGGWRRPAGAGAFVLNPVRRHAAASGDCRTQAELLKLQREGSGRAGAHPRAWLRYLSGRRC